MNRNSVSCLLISSALMLPLAATVAVAQTDETLPVQVPALAPDVTPEDASIMGIEAVDTVFEPVPIAPRHYSTTLQQIQDGTRELALNWRRSEQLIRFDLSANDHIDALSVAIDVPPQDCQTLAFVELEALREKIDLILEDDPEVDRYTEAHLRETSSRIEKVLESEMLSFPLRNRFLDVQL